MRTKPRHFINDKMWKTSNQSKISGCGLELNYMWRKWLSHQGNYCSYLCIRIQYTLTPNIGACQHWCVAAMTHGSSCAWQQEHMEAVVRGSIGAWQMTHGSFDAWQQCHSCCHCHCHSCCHYQDSSDVWQQWCVAAVMHGISGTWKQWCIAQLVK